MTLDLTGLINDQVQTTSSPNANSPIGKIRSLAKNAKDLPSCIQAIVQIASFLSHEDKEIRNAAAEALTGLIENAVKLLANVKDPKQLLEYSKALLEVTKQVQEKVTDGSVNLDSLTKTSLETSKKIIEEILQNNIHSNRSPNDSDEFVSSELNKVRRNLTGGSSPDKFVSSLNQSTRRLLNT